MQLAAYSTYILRYTFFLCSRKANLSSDVQLVTLRHIPPGFLANFASPTSPNGYSLHIPSRRLIRRASTSFRETWKDDPYFPPGHRREALSCKSARAQGLFPHETRYFYLYTTLAHITLGEKLRIPRSSLFFRSDVDPPTITLNSFTLLSRIRDAIVLYPPPQPLAIQNSQKLLKKKMHYTD